MDIKAIKCGVVSVEFPSTGRTFLKSFPLDDDAAVRWAVDALDHMQTGCGRVFAGSDVLPMNLVIATQDGVWVDADNPLRA